MIWLHINDSKPFNGQFCAVQIESIVICCEFDDDMFYDLATDDIFSIDEVDYWLPIPEPPEMEYYDDDDESDDYESGEHVNNLDKFIEVDMKAEPIHVFFLKDSFLFPDRMAIIQVNLN